MLYEDSGNKMKLRVKINECKISHSLSSITTTIASVATVSVLRYRDKTVEM